MLMLPRTTPTTSPNTAPEARRARSLTDWHNPAIILGVQAKLDYPQSHWSAAGGLAGEPVRLVPNVTHGETILVYADAEIVIEGWLPTNRLEADGPFGGYTGYMGPQVSAPVCEVSCITRRRNAITMT